MYTRPFTDELRELIDRYRERFADREDDGFGTMMVPPHVTHDELVERIERSLDEDEPIDLLAEYYDEETRRAVENGDILL